MRRLMSRLAEHHARGVASAALDAAAAEIHRDRAACRAVVTWRAWTAQVHAFMCMCTYAHMHTRTHAHMHTCTYAHVHMCMWQAHAAAGRAELVDGLVAAAGKLALACAWGAIEQAATAGRIQQVHVRMHRCISASACLVHACACLCVSARACVCTCTRAGRIHHTGALLSHTYMRAHVHRHAGKACMHRCAPLPHLHVHTRAHICTHMQGPDVCCIYMCCIYIYILHLHISTAYPFVGAVECCRPPDIHIHCIYTHIYCIYTHIYCISLRRGGRLLPSYRGWYSPRWPKSEARG